MIRDGNDPYGDNEPQQQPPPAQRITGPITDPHDPRLSDPSYASDPSVLSWLNERYGPGGTAFTPPYAGATWDPQLQGWNPKPPGNEVTPPPQPPAPAPAPGPGGGSLIAPFTQPYTPYNPSQSQPLPTPAGSVSTIPGAPQLGDIPKFTQPTIEEAMADPGYQFTLDQGNKNLQNWAGARGTLNDSSTAKAMIDYGQGAATTQYGNVWDRAFNGYKENVDTQYLQPFAAKYQNWMSGTVNPTMSNFQTQAGNVQHQNDLSFQDNWNSWLQQWNIFRDQRDSTFNKQFQTATA